MHHQSGRIAAPLAVAATAAGAATPQPAVITPAPAFTARELATLPTGGRLTNGVMTGENDAFAVSVETGAVLWEYRARIDPTRQSGPSRPRTPPRLS